MELHINHPSVTKYNLRNFTAITLFLELNISLSRDC